MAFKKPSMNKTASSINDISIYLRSVKKWGKSTLFRDMVRVKYDGDLERGVLVECGFECGDSCLDMNMTHIDTYKDLIEFKEWLLTNKGKEHNIEMVCFDTADEFVPIFEAEVVRRYNAENPQKKCKSIKAAYGGYNAGIDMAATMIKKYIADIKKAGYGVMIICHSKFKTIREKGSLEEDGYMQLTSTLGASYESCFGDIFDCTLTGVIDRVYDEKDDKKYATDSVRKLYFRGTNLIDAGGRFANGAVPEYLAYPTNMDSFEFAKLFVKTVEDGLKNSKLNGIKTNSKTIEVEKNEPISKEDTNDTIIEAEEEMSESIADEIPVEDDNIFAEEETYEEEISKEDKITKIRNSIKGNAELRTKATDIMKANNVKSFNADIPDDVLDEIYSLI